jgi:hypothetical protein
MTKPRRFAPGFYRVSLDAPVFGQIRKIGKHFYAYIHNTRTGDPVRPAGKWDTLWEAAEECVYLIPRTPIL